MKKTFLIFIFLQFSFLLNAVEGGTQFVFPKNIYVGDDVEISYTFRTEINLLFDDFDSESDFSTLKLTSDFSGFNKLSDKCFVKNASITRTGTEYTLLINAVVWKTGTIDFQPFDLVSLIYLSLPEEKFAESRGVFWIDLEPFEVGSIAEKNGVVSFLRHASPILLPGTKFLIILLSVSLVVAVFLLVFFFMHVPAISDFFSRVLLAATMKRNSRIAVRHLRKLLKKSPSFDDREFAAEFQKILRKFLCSHFKEDLSCATTNDLSRKFAKIFLDDVPVEFERFVDIFARTDYIRFAHGKSDSSFIKNAEIDERKNLVDEVVFTIIALGREVSRASVKSQPMEELNGGAL
ncbi:MAG: hypothetical protein IKN34_08665 [Treponema sp.]|nr:hypothetical protein [Treponema sp.]